MRTPTIYSKIFKLPNFSGKFRVRICSGWPLIFGDFQKKFLSSDFDSRCRAPVSPRRTPCKTTIGDGSPPSIGRSFRPMPSNVGSPVGHPALQDLSNRQFPTKNAASFPKETAASAASLSEHPPRQRILRMMALLFVMRRPRAIFPSSSLDDHMLLWSGGLINHLAPPLFHQIQLTSCDG